MQPPSKEPRRKAIGRAIEFAERHRLIGAEERDRVRRRYGLFVKEGPEIHGRGFYARRQRQGSGLAGGSRREDAYAAATVRALTEYSTIARTRSASALASCTVGASDRGGKKGAWTIRSTTPGSVRRRPFCITWRVPTTAIGTIGRPASSASRKLPALNRPTRPS